MKNSRSSFLHGATSGSSISQRPYVILTSFIHFQTHFAFFFCCYRTKVFTVKSCVFLPPSPFFWTFISLCLGDWPLQAGWWQHSTMIERPETAVSSIAVSQIVFEKDQCAKHVDTTFIFSRLIMGKLFGMLYFLSCSVPACTGLSYSIKLL